MEMTWLETIRFIGLDLQLALLLALLGLGLVERALHSAWVALRQPRANTRPRPVAAPRIAVGQVHRI